MQGCDDSLFQIHGLPMATPVYKSDSPWTGGHNTPKGGPYLDVAQMGGVRAPFKAPDDVERIDHDVDVPDRLQQKGGGRHELCSR